MEKKIMENIIGLITARIGSKRFPKKNIKLFLDHPLVAWSIIQLRCSKYIDKVFLTTDSEEIANIGENYGAEIIMRPVLDDDISANHVLKMAIEELEKNNIFTKNIFYSLPTSPLKKLNDIDNMIEYFNALLVNTKEMEPYCPEKECNIFENINDLNLINYNKPYYLKSRIKNKNYKYSRYIGGWGIGEKNYLMDKWNSLGNSDYKIDNEYYNEDVISSKIELGYAIEPWQCFETDYENYFYLCESLMKQFITGEKGIDIYIEYANKILGKNITYKKEEKQLEFNLDKYVGNLNQQ
jgi:hypothetical protein